MGGAIGRGRIRIFSEGCGVVCVDVAGTNGSVTVIVEGVAGGGSDSIGRPAGSEDDRDAIGGGASSGPWWGRAWGRDGGSGSVAAMVLTGLNVGLTGMVGWIRGLDLGFTGTVGWVGWIRGLDVGFTGTVGWVGWIRGLDVGFTGTGVGSTGWAGWGIG